MELKPKDVKIISIAAEGHILGLGDNQEVYTYNAVLKEWYQD